ncbi:type 2 isopentenyl-diphosphate Delta-isomerase [Macrococcus equipercicus]|uniref:Isopentenyl-diphosphate delta-isomerase n=1 Tax=Macrococcus equipercicus TaxID=69967 RepID=A0A9Q9BVI0_9STAP|nr:type 2 isopentenyl-diphosphate Delta-isomerase [Macrococcus equipercicus]UTH13922.1 type 2 isopentenyl-diphosphate Delta-isomerase [Macrococcus equipercicus]
MNFETSKRAQRKNEHIQLAIDHPGASSSDFDDVRFVHQSIPCIDVDQVFLSSMVGSLTFDHPLYINAMTGGSSRAGKINEKLAIVARETNIAMAVGSMHAALKDDTLSESYTIVRAQNPQGIIFSNVGADVSVELALKAVEMIKADALQIHVNAPQELIMPEGNRQFSSWLSTIEEIVKQVEVPVIVKEVGFGMSQETFSQLRHIGVNIVDVSGRGGTDFIHIENERRSLKEMTYLTGWGQSTVVSLLEARSSPDFDVLASGGIRHPLDAVKCYALGAKAVGMSRTMLLLIEEQGVEGAIQYIESFKEQLTIIAAMLNARNLQELKERPIVFSPELLSWQEQRGLQ